MQRNYISGPVIEQTVLGIRGILEETQRDIEVAFMNEENTLSVSLTVKYSLEKEAVKIETTILKSSYLPGGLKIPSYTETAFEVNGSKLK